MTMRRVLTILGLIVLLAAGPAPAQEVFEVPIELELPDAPLVVALDDASLEVVLKAGTVPVLRALGDSEDGASSAALAITDSGTIEVRRAERAHGDARKPRLRLELVFTPGRRLQVTGSDLDVSVEVVPVAESDRVEEDEGAARPVAPAIGNQLFLEVTRSSVNLFGVVGPRISATDSFVHASGTRGQLILVLAGGTVESEEHQGAVDLSGRGSEVVLSDTVGRVKLALIDGSLNVRGGSGNLDGSLNDAQLRVDGRRGSIIVAGSRARVEARDMIGANIEIKGGGHEVTIDELQGAVIADLSGGSLTVSELRGQATITARAGAEVTIDGVVGRPTLNLTDSSANVVDVVGQLSAEVRRGSLEVDDVQRLELVARGAEIVASRLETLTKAEITSSQVDLDLQGLKHNPNLTLMGSTQARVRMHTPCSVKTGAGRLFTADITVSGCDVQNKTIKGRRKQMGRRGLDGQKKRTLNVLLKDGSTLEVDGVP